MEEVWEVVELGYVRVSRAAVVGVVIVSGIALVVLVGGMLMPQSVSFVVHVGMEVEVGPWVDDGVAECDFVVAGVEIGVDVVRAEEEV